MRRALVFLLLALPLPAGDDEEIPPGPLKDLMEGLERGDKEIVIDVYQSPLNGVEYWLKKDRAKGIVELEKFLADLRPELAVAEPDLGPLTAYADAITFARKYKVSEIKDDYRMRAPPKGFGGLQFGFPVSARWRCDDLQSGEVTLSQLDRKGEWVRSITFRIYAKVFTYEHEDKPFDGLNSPMLAKSAKAAADRVLLKVRKRTGVTQARLNERIPVASSFYVDGDRADGESLRYRSYYFRVKGRDDASFSVTVSHAAGVELLDPESAAVIATIRGPD